jgi:hypothetical protein
MKIQRFGRRRNAAEHFFIITLHSPHGKDSLLLSSIILGIFTAPLHSNGRGADHIENILSVVVALVYESLPSNGCTRHNINSDNDHGV